MGEFYNWLSLLDWKRVLAKRNQNCVADEIASYVPRMGVGAEWSSVYPE
jgi:hypothetical protein